MIFPSSNEDVMNIFINEMISSDRNRCIVRISEVAGQPSLHCGWRTV